jgi:diguanylate cyclase (GGDEF)-like protein
MPKDTSQVDFNLLEQQVKPLFKTTLLAGLANIFAACLIFLLLNDTNYEIYALWLSIGIILFSTLRIILSKHYLIKNKFKLQTYLNAHILLTFVIGLIWAIFEFMQYQQNDESLRNIVFLINFGLIAGSVATLSIYRKAYLAYMLPQAIAIFSVFILLDTNISYYMAFAFFVFMALMISTSFNINRSHKKGVQLTLNNKRLIGDLNNEIVVRENVQHELEQNKLDLENKVKERTKELVDINLHLENALDKKEVAEQSLQYLAYHDELTGLPNKNLLVDRINQSIKTSARDKQKMAILFLDLDRFKNINDSLGHTIGDILLQQVSLRLFKTLRRHDTISRNSGDEFVVVLERLKNSDEAIHVAKKVINCLKETFVVNSHKIHIGASVGISVYPTDGDTPLILLRNADTAMYRSKQAGGNQLHFYDQSMSNQLRNRLELENELHNAIQNNEFYMVYQPQVNCLTNETIGFESLIRWNNKKYGEISPDRFIPLLEETGLIYSVGEWVVTQVINFIKLQNINHISFSINLSALQCDNLGFIAFLSDEINRSGINPEQIEFEITETLLIKDFERTRIFLNELHSIGCAIALDDFGTGYTSMNYLARLPIDIIKIDKSLIRNIDVNNNLMSIVKAIVTMSKSLGMENIFEGIETKAELSAIKDLSGNIIQGYLFSGPLIENEVESWLSSDKTIKLA